MTIKVAVNGFGRIGRCVTRVIFDNNIEEIELVAINSTATVVEDYHLLKYDSVHGRFNHDVSYDDQDNIIINGKKIKSFSERDPANLPWDQLDIDVVLECTGIFCDINGASKHVSSGAKKVLLSAPAKSPEIKTVIYKVNDDIITKDDQILSIGSCTTNCLAPVIKVIHDNFKIEQGYVTTIHAYTNDQNLTDANHKDKRRARAAALSMIPTSTGAAKAIGKVITDLNGKLDGCAIRVPTPNVSLIDFTFTTEKSINESEINNLMKSNVSNMLGYSDEPLVSIDYNKTNQSSIFDATATKVINKRFGRVAAWYDNEWSFANRMLDVTKLIF